jgi:hypothetical protein
VSATPAHPPSLPSLSPILTRNLPSPLLYHALVQSNDALFGDHARRRLQGAGQGGRNVGLRAHLDGFEGADRDSGVELCAGGGGEVDSGLLALGVLATGEGYVCRLGVLASVPTLRVSMELRHEFKGHVLNIPAVFTCSHRGEPDERQGSAGVHPAHVLGWHDRAPHLEVALVRIWVDMAAAIDDAQRGDGGVCYAL